jgi:hypothetical protein
LKRRRLKKMVKTKLQKIGIMSVAKFSGIYGLLIGLIAGIIIAVASAMLDDLVPGGASMMYGWGAIIWAPVAYGIGGFLSGIIGGFLFNIIAKMAGGIEMHFKELE